MNDLTFKPAIPVVPEIESKHDSTINHSKNDLKDVFEHIFGCDITYDEHLIDEFNDIKDQYTCIDLLNHQK
jgi:enoyl-[acyl-carrier-protein] reductase (NADH)